MSVNWGWMHPGAYCWPTDIPSVYDIPPAGEASGEGLLHRFSVPLQLIGLIGRQASNPVFSNCKWEIRGESLTKTNLDSGAQGL